MLSRHLDVRSGFVVDRPPPREHCSARWRIPIFVKAWTLDESSRKCLLASPGGRQELRGRAVNAGEHIEKYLASIAGPRQGDMRTLHDAILGMNPGCRLWFLDGTDESGKIVSNPNIGFGALRKKYADGRTKEFYQVGISANTAGLSVYIMGIDDKQYLKQTYANAIGKAQVTGYCIKFKALKDIDLDVLKAAIQDGIEQTRT